MPSQVQLGSENDEFNTGGRPPSGRSASGSAGASSSRGRLMQTTSTDFRTSPTPSSIAVQPDAKLVAEGYK